MYFSVQHCVLLHVYKNTTRLPQNNQFPQTHPTTYNRLKKHLNMKVAILVLAFVALTASVAYTAPTENEDAEIEAFVNKLMEQEEASEQDDHAAQMESFLAQLQDEDDDGEEADLQEFFAREQIPAKVQGWRRAVRSVVKGVKKYGPTALKYGKKYGPTVLKYGKKYGPSVVKALGRR